MTWSGAAQGEGAGDASWWPGEVKGFGCFARRQEELRIERKGSAI